MKYKRLPGGRRGVLRRYSLWLGDDHLLAVTCWRFVEDYKRYYYRDIQAVVLARSRRWVLTLPWIVAALALIVTAGIANTVNAGGVAQASLDSLAGLALIWLLLAMMAGARCRIQTAVGCDDLPSLFRSWSGQRALRILAGHIAQVQGTLVEGWTAETVETPAQAPVAEPEAREAQAAPPRPGGISALEIAFYASLGLGSVLFFAPSGWIWFVLILVQIGPAMAAIILHGRRGGLAITRGAAIVSLILVGVMGTAAYGMFVVRFVEAGGFTPGRAPRLPEVPGVVPALPYVYAALCLAIGAVGLGRRLKE
jgi:hypothetical protein